ncbi:MAG: hypothetical protein AABX84_00550 [Nanoarchaeota archaeon]
MVLSGAILAGTAMNSYAQEKLPGFSDNHHYNPTQTAPKIPEYVLIGHYEVQKDALMTAEDILSTNNVIYPNNQKSLDQVLAEISGGDKIVTLAEAIRGEFSFVNRLNPKQRTEYERILREKYLQTKKISKK